MLEGKTIAVTGVASGIGAETAAELTRQGANVVGIDRTPTDGLDQFHQVDLSDAASIDDLIQALPTGLDGLCNIAGLPPTAPASAVMTVNLLALRRLSEGLAPKLAEGASITHLASLAGIGWPDAVQQVTEALALDFGADVEGFCSTNALDEGGRSYFLSKECVQVYTMMNRWRWRERGIRMNCISPGPVDTPILPDFLETLGERAEEDMKIMDRPGHPTDIAPVVAFLQSDGSRWLRGANLTADGGMSSHIMMHMHGLET